LETERLLEPGELASITRFELDETFWWVWMSSLAPEETADRKSAFGRCAVIETVIQSGTWLVMEEMVKGAAPEPDENAYIAEKKGFFSWTRRGRGMSRSKSTSKGAFDRKDRLHATSTVGSGYSKTSIGPDQQAKIQAAAQQLSARQQQQQGADLLPERRGRADADVLGDKTNSVLTLQPVIMKEASPAMKWASKYDKETIRQAYLGNMEAGRGLGQLHSPTETSSHGMRNDSMTNGNDYKPQVPEKALSPLSSGVQSPTVPNMQQPVKEEPPIVPEKNLEDIHPAERPGPVDRNSPLPPLPQKDESMEVARQTTVSPEPGSMSPESKKQHKKLHKDDKKTGGGGFRKLFGRNKNRQSKLPENAATDVNNFLAAESIRTAESSRADSPLPETPRPQPVVTGPVHETSTIHTEDDKTPTQLSAPVGTREPAYDASAEADVSRVNSADADQAHDEFSRFDQGPLADQPAFAPPELESDYEDDATPPPIARHPGEQEQEQEQGHEIGAAPSPTIATQDRWAAIRRNAAERAARQSEEQSRGAYSKTTDGDDETSGEESKSTT
jgi:hypothetical protein